jgi:FKBP-type peptidyl-prolyl cis-trans isomerase SlyD
MSILMENDKGQTKTFIVTRVNQKSITIDGNNPLCGREVIFRLLIKDVRDATEEEREFGGQVEKVPDVEGTVKVPLQ